MIDPIRFRRQLLDWYDRSARDLPWRRDQDPYRVWISEIMLQQTRVAAVIPYYERFLERFPTADALASAAEEDLLKAWAGLGYYSRARNLQRAARQMNRSFPKDYDAIRALAGIGEYTAAAIASIAFGLPYAAVDGNVKRVLTRVTMSEAGMAALAQRLLDPRRPGDFNQAMMELGATICTPRNPQCLLCPVAEFCEARHAGVQDTLPVSRKPKQIRVERILLAARRGKEMLFWRRADNERKLAGFWELPDDSHFPKIRRGKELGRFRHSITNVNYVFTICEIKIHKVPDGFAWLPVAGPVDYLLSTTARKALRVLSKVV